jgi:hypothetical protein
LKNSKFEKFKVENPKIEKCSIQKLKNSKFEKFNSQKSKNAVFKN